MNGREDWIAERVAVIMEGNTYRVGARWVCSVTELEAREQAETEYNAAKEAYAKLKREGDP